MLHGRTARWRTRQRIGVDMNDDMLALARKYQAEMAAKNWFGSSTVCQRPDSRLSLRYGRC